MLHPKEESVAFDKYMAIFGRPLWSAYNETKLDEIARAKLLGGNTETTKHNTGSRDHVFAVLSARLYIDLNLQLANHAIPLGQKAVHLHMRRLESLDVSD